MPQSTVNCDPQSLANAASAFMVLSPRQLEAIKTYILAIMAGVSTDPNVLAGLAKCFVCYNGDQLAIQNYLLCQLVNSGGGGSNSCVLCLDSNPVDPPTCDCAMAVVRTNGSLWYWDSGLLTWNALLQ